MFVIASARNNSMPDSYAEVFENREKKCAAVKCAAVN